MRSTYFLTAQDRGIPASAQHQMAGQGTHLHTADTGRSTQLSQPGLVVYLIEHTAALISVPDPVGWIRQGRHQAELSLHGGFRRFRSIRLWE